MPRWVSLAVKEVQFGEGYSPVCHSEEIRQAGKLSGQWLAPHSARTFAGIQSRKT